MSKQIGWIGTGVMGRWMAEHLMNAGMKVFLYTRTQAKAQPLIEKGAIWCSTIPELASQCPVVFTMVGYPHDVREVVLGENGILNHMSPGGLFIDHTTSSPQLAQEISEVAQKKQILAVDAPVSGGDVGAKNGQLAIMCGGTEEGFSNAKPFFDAYGKNVQHMGPAGAGQSTKMMNQIVIAGNMIGMVEGLVYAYKAGLPLQKAIDLLSSGAAMSFSLKVLGPRILRRDMEPGFYIEHFIKDMGIALEESQRMKIALPGLALVNQLYKSLLSYGLEKKGTQALAIALENLNNLQIKEQ